MNTVLKTFNYLFSVICSYGPNSQEVKEKVEELDSDIGYLLEKLEAAGISDDINIIITSDHGELFSTHRHSNIKYFVRCKAVFYNISKIEK